MSGPSSTTPYSFIKRGQLFITPVGPSIAEVPYPTYPITKPKDYSLWVNGKVEEPAFQLDHARMPPSMYQEVRDDLVRFSPVEVSRSAFRRSDHAYVGVIDSKGTPYYFALDSRGMSVREVPADDDCVWKTFDKLADAERAMAIRLRRHDATTEMVNVDRELSAKLVILKGGASLYWDSKGKQHGSRHVSQGHPAAAHAVNGPRRGGLHQHDHHPTKQKKLKPFRPGKAPAEAKEKTAKQPREKKQKQPREKKPRQLRPLSPKPYGPKAPSKTSAWKVKYPGGSVKTMKSDAERIGKKYASEMRRVGHVIALQTGEEDLDPPRHDDLSDVEKALPKKSKEKPVKKQPTVKASSKKVGAGGKPRYTYPNEKKKKAAKPGGAKPGAKQTPLVVAVEHDDSKHADPGELANQLNVSVRTLQHTARKLGREGFSKFMRSHLKRFAAKHRLDPNYWNTLYERLRAVEPSSDMR